jgi:hypothetical protein
VLIRLLLQETNSENRFTCQLCSAQTYLQTCRGAGIGSSRKCGVRLTRERQAGPEMDKGCNLCKCKPRSAGEDRSVTLKNLVRSEVRSGVRVRKKCLNHPTAAEHGCCQFAEKVIKIANENLVRGEVRVKYAARTRTNGLRTSPPDCRFSGSVEAHRLLAGLTDGLEFWSGARSAVF